VADEVDGLCVPQGVDLQQPRLRRLERVLVLVLVLLLRRRGGGLLRLRLQRDLGLRRSSGTRHTPGGEGAGPHCRGASCRWN
jgi:hypothetical protein